jgi:type II pantothenate kinase
MLKLGVDFGLSNTDAVLVEKGRIVAQQIVPTDGANLGALWAVLRALEVEVTQLGGVASSGGLSRHLPEHFDGLKVHRIPEPKALACGALALSGLSEALVVSAGTGTAMISARGSDAFHFTGSAVGGGTLQGLGKLLLGTSDPLEIARLAEMGNTSEVDSTLIDVIGGGIGHLPADATAVNFGRALKLENPRREDVAAALVTLVSQVIAMVAINAVKAAGLKQIVIVGHLPDLAPIRGALERVWYFYQIDPKPVIPERSGFATAYGAVLAMEER